MPTPLHRFYHRHAGWVVACIVGVCLVSLVIYDAAAQRQQKQRQAATCEQIATLYDTIIRLVQIQARVTLSFSAADVAKLRRQRAERISACNHPT